MDKGERVIAGSAEQRVVAVPHVHRISATCASAKRFETRYVLVIPRLAERVLPAGVGRFLGEGADNHTGSSARDAG
jgi:hypothetical protein